MLSRAFGCLTMLVLAALLYLLHPLLLGIAGDLLVADEPLMPADALIVLAGNSPYRADRAVELYRQHWAPRLIVSDEQVRTHGFVSTWHDLYADGQAHLDVPRDAVLVLPGIATDTRDEAIRSRDLMLQNGWKRAILVTDPFHSRRAALLFRHVFDPAGLQVVSSPALRSPENTDRWWESTDKSQSVVNEYVKLAWAALHGNL